MYHRSRSLQRQMRSLHRGTSTAAATLIIILAVTGILLNHTNELKLDQRFLTWSWLLEHYGVTETQPAAVYGLKERIISQFDHQVFLDGQAVIQVYEEVLGAVGLEEISILATRDSLYLLTTDGEFIEQLSSATGIPDDIQRIGLYGHRPAIQNPEGIWLGDDMLDSWEINSVDNIEWSYSLPLPEKTRIQLEEYFQGKGISLERFILDVHNGHILGAFSVWLMDIFAALLVLIALTGLWMRWR